MKLNFVAPLLAMLGLLGGCTTTAISSAEAMNMVTGAGFNASKGAGFVPIEPTIAQSQVTVNRNGQLVTTDIRLLTNQETLDFLADTQSKVAVSKVDKNGNLTYLAGSLSAEKGRYVVVMDYTKFFIEDMIENGKKIGRLKTGVGLRLFADVKTSKVGIDLGGLLKIGLAAGRQELSGSLEVRAIGVTSTDIDSLLPGTLPTINESSIQTALEAMAAVKAKFRERETVVSPRHVAVELVESTQSSLVKAPGL
ncbi:MAG TPA: hypothetical protein VMF52_14030 [Steroidobacteraceae bacterium]|nr:hypothetical protein [Steroidobacteraceae bacterium]